MNAIWENHTRNPGRNLTSLLKSKTALLIMSDMFTAIDNKLHGKTTSKVERVFRTVNMRINVGKWSTAGGLNVTKVRLAYYYNGFDA